MNLAKANAQEIFREEELTSEEGRVTSGPPRSFQKTCPVIRGVTPGNRKEPRNQKSCLGVVKPRTQKKTKN